MNVVVATPSSGQCKFCYATSLARMVAYFAQFPVWPEIETQMLDVTGYEGSGISANRDRLVDMALSKHEMTHVLWIDDDMEFVPNVMHILASRRQPIVGVNYRMRFPPSDFTALNLARTGRVQTKKESTGIEPVTYVGFGVCLMERCVLEAVQKPRFLLRYQDGHYSTEDSVFFDHARAAGYAVYVDHDASKGVAHRGDMIYRWDMNYPTIGVTDGK